MRDGAPSESVGKRSDTLDGGGLNEMDTCSRRFSVRIFPDQSGSRVDDRRQVGTRSACVLVTGWLEAAGAAARRPLIVVDRGGRAPRHTPPSLRAWYSAADAQ